MLLETTISLAVVITLTLVMSFLLARVVKQVNRDSKDFFEKKIVVYDDLIDEKQKHLDAIKSEIENIKVEPKEGSPEEKNALSGNHMIVVNEKLPDYKIDDFFEQAKKIDEEFKLNKDEAVKSFVKDRIKFNGNSIAINDLKILYDKLSNERSYDYIVSSDSDDWSYVEKMMTSGVKDIMEPYMAGSPNADINEILGYMKLELDKVSPEIIVETGDKNDNFGYINGQIKTVYNPNIYMGIRIFYQDRMYEYSLRGAV